MTCPTGVMLQAAECAQSRQRPVRQQQAQGLPAVVMSGQPGML